MFSLKSIRWCCGLVWPLFIYACAGESPPPDVKAIDLVEQKEKMFARLQADLKQQNGSSFYNLGIVRQYARSIEETLGSVRGTHVLEIGPGRNLAVGVALVLRGARRYSAVDIYEHPQLYDPIVYRNLLSLGQSAEWGGFNPQSFSDLVRVDGDRVHLDPDRIVWLYPHESYAFPMPDGDVDYAFSHSGFEHFNEPRKTIERLFQVLRPGGVTAHSIDLRDHEDFSRPFEFLKLSAEDWRGNFTEENLYNYTNRWRAVDFLREFKAAGFEILEDRQKQEAQVTEELKRSFHSDFQGYSLDELSATYLWIVARKPAAEEAAEPSEPATSR